MCVRRALTQTLLPVLVSVAATAAAAPTFVRSDLPINLDAKSSDFDYRNNVLHFRQVKVTQGSTSIEADEATGTGLDFSNSHWEFKGNVRIVMPESRLDSDAADLRFTNNTLDMALITGAPARFEQKRDKGVARGRAARIEYDFGSQTVRLTEQAWLSYNDGEMNGRTLVYNIRDQRVIANPLEQNDQRVHITIQPASKGPQPVPAGAPP